MNKKNFYITFGVQYTDHLPHPQGGHKDGWFRIITPDEETAREKAFAVCGNQWSFLYDEEDFEKAKHHFPRGELKVIETTFDGQKVI